MTKVESSNIDAIGYDYQEEILIVRFNSGATYEYYGVPEAMYKAIMDADSKGKFLNKNIKNAYDYARI